MRRFFGRPKGEAARQDKSLAPNTRPQKLMLGTGDRIIITATISSDELAAKLLKEAQTLAQNKAQGEKVSVSVSEENTGIHHMELLFSMMFLAPDYGLAVSYQHDNSFELRKLWPAPTIRSSLL